ncbi:MAG: DUF389 domain-containing protein [Sulfuriferula sp.]
MRINQISRLDHRFKKWWVGMVETVHHQTILTQVDEDGAPTYSYAFMVTISAGIAMIGLLLNSPAVIIGAMLISPLMGPIVLSGISLSTLNYASARKGAQSLIVGVFLALAITILIVWASPITDATAEILARTRPNLFDLVVAILSGLAGGYAVIRGRGGAIVGVAIATALMPPLAVVGYGVATAQWTLARGATLLFVTNMLAIALSVAFVATWYGFGRRGLRRELVWQSGIALLILIPLAVPLVLSLQTIAHETYISSSARQVLDDVLKDSKSDSRIVQFQPVFRKNTLPVIDVILVTQATQTDLVKNADNHLAALLGEKVQYRIDQIVVNDVRKLESPPSAIANPIQTGYMATSQPNFSDTFRKSFPLETEHIDVDENAKIMRIFPKPGAGADILSLYRLEKSLMDRFPGWKIAIVAPAQPLPQLYYDPNQTVLAGTETEKLQAIIWTLQAWKVHAVSVVGHASTLGRTATNQRRAAKRADEISKLLKNAGFEVTQSHAYPMPHQRNQERQLGYGAFRSVDITLSNNLRATIQASGSVAAR